MAGILSGKLVEIVPPNFTDSYGNSYQDITIQTDEGRFAGKIVSRHPYTQQAIGQMGQWTWENKKNKNGEDYLKFKKYNEKYAQSTPMQNAPPQPPQTQYAPPQPPSQNAQPPAGQPNAAEAKDMRTVRGNALNAVLSATDIPLDMVKEYLLASVGWIMTGDWTVKLYPVSTPKPPVTNDSPEYDEPDF